MEIISCNFPSQTICNYDSKPSQKNQNYRLRALLSKLSTIWQYYTILEFTIKPFDIALNIFAASIFSKNSHQEGRRLNYVSCKFSSSNKNLVCT